MALGWDVVLKATARHLRHRPDMAHVWRNIDNEEEMRDAWQTMSSIIDSRSTAGFVVQRHAPAGVPILNFRIKHVSSQEEAGANAELEPNDEWAKATPLPALTDADPAKREAASAFQSFASQRGSISSNGGLSVAAGEGSNHITLIRRR